MLELGSPTFLSAAACFCSDAWYVKWENGDAWGDASRSDRQSWSEDIEKVSN